ncbi:von Willebrand factor A-like protein [Gracilaria domingensis]|nr:von Willebrand factor A-like protein [Gracilaria domingensis]
MMKFLISVIAVALCISAHATVVEELPVTGRITAAARADLRRRIKAAGDCNLNICFAIDGSSSISDTEFVNERNFVLDVSSVVVDKTVELGAVQYSTSVRTITPLTPDSATFNLLVNFEQQLGGASFVVGGINACFSQLAGRPNEPGKIVLLGDGRSSMGSDAAERADLFRSIGGSVCVVGAGFADDAELMRIAGGDRSLVFEVDNFLDVLALERVVEDLAVQMCGVRK